MAKAVKIDIDFWIFAETLSPMTLVLAHTNGEMLPLTPGLPAGYSGPVMHGAQTSHIDAAFGQVIIQEYTTDYVSIRKLTINWKKPERLLCKYTYANGIFSRAMVHGSLHEYLKGAGEIHLNRDQFSLLAGSEWMGVLIGAKSGEYNCVDMHWSAAAVQAVSSDPLLNEIIDNCCSGVADRITGAAHGLNSEMSRLVALLQHMNFSMVKARELLHRDMKKYLSLALQELNDHLSLKKKMRETEWDIVDNAKRLIEDNNDKHFSTPELSTLIGMNEHKLKKLFPLATGFKVDEYRKYLLYRKTAKKIIQMREEPLKNFFEEAGYTSLTTFIRGFRKICYCTPGELRLNTWDLGGITQTNDE